MINNHYNMRLIYLLLLVVYGFPLYAQQNTFWRLEADGSIRWAVKPGEVHSDHIEMSGKQLSAIVRYGQNATGRPTFSRKLVFPMLRSIPNDTRANLIREFAGSIMDSVMIGDGKAPERLESFSIRGYLRAVSTFGEQARVTRNIFPSTDKPALIESYTVTNLGRTPLNVQIPAIDSNMLTSEKKGVYGAYILNCKAYNSGKQVIAPNGSLRFWVVYSARKQYDEPYYISDRYEWSKRLALVDGLQQKLVLHTPNDTIDRMFAFAKVRAAESIYDTRQGLMHSPGGGEYYAAIWANDQAEYVNPFFAYLGNTEGIESARNSFRVFAGYMNPAYKPIPSSIISEGAGYWNGAGDRGDQAMIGYGAAKFALTNGDTADAETLWPLVEWCNNYLLRQQSPEGVIFSDSDELEGRFPAGKYNLSTNTLAYGSFLYGARLAEALGETAVAAEWRNISGKLKKSIEAYFGATVEGFDTYRYYAGNGKLRSWICLPLVMGIYDRQAGTQAALLSPKLWSPNGLLTASGSATFWDRSTLYAFRGLLKAGATDAVMPYLSYYSGRRLLGEHVPYAIEAWPEGNQRHLSAESGLFCRAIVEGLFGFEPLGFRTFSIKPVLPAKWPAMSLNNIHAFNTQFSITAQRAAGKYTVTITETGKRPKQVNWDGKRPLTFTL